MSAGKAPIEVFIENEAGSLTKCTYDETSLELLNTATVSSPYPYPYGFVRGTLSGDGDSVDCFIVTDAPLKSGDRIACEPLYLLEQIEDGEIDHKVLAICTNDAGVISDEAVAKIRDFILTVFEHIPNKSMQLGALCGAEDAWAYIDACRECRGPVS